MSRARRHSLATGSGLALLAGLALLTLGCGGAVAGKWRLIKAIPNREVFALDDVEFRRDGGYSAVLTLEGKTRPEEGAYEFNGFKLTLRPRLGGQRQYNAVRRPGAIEIMDDERKLILEKQ